VIALIAGKHQDPVTLGSRARGAERVLRRAVHRIRLAVSPCCAQATSRARPDGPIVAQAELRHARARLPRSAPGGTVGSFVADAKVGRASAPVVVLPVPQHAGGNGSTKPSRASSRRRRAAWRCSSSRGRSRTCSRVVAFGVAAVHAQPGVADGTSAFALAFASSGAWRDGKVGVRLTSNQIRDAVLRAVTANATAPGSGGDASGSVKSSATSRARRCGAGRPSRRSLTTGSRRSARAANESAVSDAVGAALRTR
jgi:hypothetical protein